MSSNLEGVTPIVDMGEISNDDGSDKLERLEEVIGNRCTAGNDWKKSEIIAVPMSVGRRTGEE